MEVRKNLIHNGFHRPVSLQPLEEALIPEPAQLPVAQLPGSGLYVPHRLHLHSTQPSALVQSTVKHPNSKEGCGHAATMLTHHVGSSDV